MHARAQTQTRGAHTFARTHVRMHTQNYDILTFPNNNASLQATTGYLAGEGLASRLTKTDSV